jgi:NAD(P)H-hydrate epimerase
MAHLPLAIYSEAQLRALDRYATERCGIPSYTLMSRAGESALRTLRHCWPDAKQVVVLCGPGNNGGDGYVLARAAIAQRLNVQVVALTEPANLKGDARRASEDYRAAGGATRSWHRDVLSNADVVVDAIFGLGLTRAIDGEIASCIQAVGNSNSPVLSLDLPSGLAADSGRVYSWAIRADRTVSFVGLKLGFYLGVGPNHTGVVTSDSLEIPSIAYDKNPAAAFRIDEKIVARTLPTRRRTAHKGHQGRVLLIGGGVGMPGAARLAGEAALRVGSGVVTVATRAENVAAITGARPELICRAITHGSELPALIDHAEVVAIGPGLGQDEWSQSMFDAIQNCDKPIVVDADALNLLARRPRKNTKWVLTPHPGEAGRLISKNAGEVQFDRLSAAREIVSRYGGVVVLKGAGTLVLDEGDVPYICDHGNPGMATPGTGDVLTGVIAGVLAQCESLADAACTGVLVHAMAGDMAAHRGERGLLASDLFEYLPTCVNSNP